MFSDFNVNHTSNPPSPAHRHRVRVCPRSPSSSKPEAICTLPQSLGHVPVCACALHSLNAVYAWDSEKRNFDPFIFQVHVKRLTKKIQFNSLLDQTCINPPMKIVPSTFKHRAPMPFRAHFPVIEIMFCRVSVPFVGN